MKYLILLLMTVLVQVSQAETLLNELTLKSNVQGDRGEFHLWSENGQFYIEYFSNTDHSPSDLRKSEVTEEQVNFLKEKLDELKLLKDSPDCVNREITANYKWGDKTIQHKGCMDSQDEISTGLYQLSSIMRILI